MGNDKNLVLGSIQFGPEWSKYFALDKKINDRVALDMYKALKAIVRSSKLQSYKCKDQKAFDKCFDALVQYETSYNKN
jgi:hypothetical protein